MWEPTRAGSLLVASDAISPQDLMRIDSTLPNSL
jgi:hypothetical protein